MKPNDEQKVKTKEKITKATLEVISEVGFDKATVRKIAAKANVNIALISYYFESKEGAVIFAMNELSGEFQNCFDILIEKGHAPVQRLHSFFQRYAEVAHKYPYVMRSLISSGSLFKEMKLLSYLKDEGFRRFRLTIEEIHPVEDERALFIRFFQAICAIAFPTLLADNMEALSGIAYNDPTARNEYIGILLSSFL